MLCTGFASNADYRETSHCTVLGQADITKAALGGETLELFRAHWLCEAGTGAVKQWRLIGGLTNTPRLHGKTNGLHSALKLD